MGSSYSAFEVHQTSKSEFRLKFQKARKNVLVIHKKCE